ncbi:hypothetical protein G7Y79_00031g065710 [Physcia stellaris]|nr:hypothetical protein G7Y79_00031g065710 [Physcia stellaris]
MDEKLDINYLFEIVHQLESQLPTDHKQRWLELIHARLTLARYLFGLERIDEFSAQINETDLTLKNLSWIEPSDAPALWLRKLQISSRVPRNMEYLAAWLELASAMQENEDFRQETSVLLDIHLILYEVDGLKRDSTWLSVATANLERLDEIDSDTGNALSTSDNLSRFGRIDFTTTTASEYLHRLRNFESRFPEFDVPFHRLALYTGASDAALKLADIESYQHYDAKSAIAWANLPPELAFQTFRYRGKSCSDWPLDFFVTLHQWMKLDYKEGSLSPLAVTQLLVLNQGSASPEQMADETLAADLGPDQTEQLADRIYGDVDNPVDASVWDSHFGRYQRWLWDSPVRVDRGLRHTMLLDMQTARETKLLDYHRRKNNPRDFVDHELQLKIHRLRIAERSRMAELRKRVDRGAVGASQVGGLSDEWHLMSLKNGLAHSIKAVQDGILTDDDLHEVQTWMSRAYCEDPGFLKKMRLISLSTSALAMRHRYNIFGTTTPDAALAAYKSCDEIYIGLRRERSILRGSKNLTARAQNSAEFGDTDHHIAAMACCIEAMGPARMQARWQRVMGQGQHRDFVPTPAPERSSSSLMCELIDWAQKRKARSVTEVLGAEIIIPHTVLAGVKNDETAMGLLRTEAELQTKFDSHPSEPIELSKQLERVRKGMRDCPSLEQVMNLRDGVAITFPQILALSHGLGPHVILVDYVYLPSSSTAVPNEIICMVYKNGAQYSSNWVTPDLNYARLNEWVEKAFAGEHEPLSTDEAGEHLAELLPLIIDAVKATEPGDTIVMCPTSVLFSIPLHAIPVDQEPLIERNPVVYTQSLTILYMCAVSASSLTADPPANPVAIQALSDAESMHASAPTMAFAHKIGARLLSGSSLTKSSFLEAITRSSLIHFYGHVKFKDFEDSSPLDHYMAIRGIESERVTARELFDIRLRSGAHVNLIGCESGMSDVRPNDDQFGLSTALLYAGAGSILTARWEIRMEDAHEFQEAFYEEFLVQLSGDARRLASEGGADAEQFVDTAKALQKATVRVSKNTDGTRKAPYHWAAFMLQGDWKALPILSFHE